MYLKKQLLICLVLVVFSPITIVFGQSNTWCPPVACDNCDIIISDNSADVSAKNETVCFQGDFTFKRLLEVTNGTICISEGVTIEVDDLEELQGNWTIHNHGTIQLSKEFRIGNGQSFYNYGNFKINTIEDASINKNEMVIENGGLYCNSGYTFVSGDVQNYGIIKSSGLFEIADEFFNHSTGEAYITEMIVKDEISNGGTIYLEGYIESLNKSFKNLVGAKVIGLDHPCNAIKAFVTIENYGLIDGTLGPIVLGIDENDFVKGETDGEIFYRNSDNLSEDCFRVLPVEWAGLTIQYSGMGRNVRINWTTLKEMENSHFELQRSLGGIIDFKNIGEVTGMGWKDTLTEYAFEDNEVPLSGGNIFYRIKQVDLNGTYSYSKVLSVQVPALEITHGVWRAYPNPTSGGAFRLEILNPQHYNGEEVQVRLFAPSARGKYFSGQNVDDISKDVSSILERLPKGLFILEITWGKKFEYIKILKR